MGASIFSDEGAWKLDGREVMVVVVAVDREGVVGLMLVSGALP